MTATTPAKVLYILQTDQDVEEVYRTAKEARTETKWWNSAGVAVNVHTYDLRPKKRKAKR